MREKTLNKFKADEKGQALLIVLILLVIGGLIIVPLLGYMSTGLIVGQTYEARMDEVYAADAGIEDAILKIMNNQVPADPYHLTVNGKDVEVTASSNDDTEITLLINLEVLPDVPASYNKAKPQAKWLVVYKPIESSTVPGTYDTYRITGYYRSTQRRDIVGTGFWIYLYDGSAEVIPWHPGIDGTVEIDTDGDDETPDIPVATKPLIDGYENDDYPDPVRTVDYLGTAFIWEWGIGDGPLFGQNVEGGQDVFCRTQRFTLDPSLTLSDGHFPPNIAWLQTKQESISISCTGEVVGIKPIIATATDLTTDKSTTVTSYVFHKEIDGSVIITILTWDISLQ